jgi:hypothetical protein
MTAENQTRQLVLPLLIVSMVDLARVTRELDALDDFLHQSSIRTPGSPTTQLPRSSRLLEELAVANRVSLLEEGHRAWLKTAAEDLKEHNTQIHISFAAEPSAAFTRQVLVWLRQNIHPQLLLDIGLQPAIAAGCVVRTTNRVFDMSLRQFFQDNRALLLKKLEEAS